MDSHQSAYAIKRRDIIAERVKKNLELAETNKSKRIRNFATNNTEGHKRIKLMGGDTLPSCMDLSTMQPDLPGEGVVLSASITSNARNMEDPFAAENFVSQLSSFGQSSDLIAYSAPVHTEINWLSWIN